MDGLVKDYYSIKYISSLHESRLGWLNNMIGDRVEPISRNFGEDFEADIKEADRSELLNLFSLLGLWQQNNLAKIKPR